MPQQVPSSEVIFEVLLQKVLLNWVLHHVIGQTISLILSMSQWDRRLIAWRSTVPPCHKSIAVRSVFLFALAKYRLQGECFILVQISNIEKNLDTLWIYGETERQRRWTVQERVDRFELISGNIINFRICIKYNILCLTASKISRIPTCFMSKFMNIICQEVELIYPENFTRHQLARLYFTKFQVTSYDYWSEAIF